MKIQIYPYTFSGSTSLYYLKLDRYKISQIANLYLTRSHTTLPPYHDLTTPHIATTLLKKVAQMGAIISYKTSSSLAPVTMATAAPTHQLQNLIRPHKYNYMSIDSASSNKNTTAGFGLNLSFLFPPSFYPSEFVDHCHISVVQKLCNLRYLFQNFMLQF